ncbi:hypothetical protein MJO28_000317 [Puccinia striiformis f. sp. tritici]|uniref:Uncharacterized protein n=1 Tax=Puccinia striiformis f. sp. tritici TaxID=168172 RepID=A0ACC0EZG0_9BASI|nr:hypothetical protein MJO28_000317 [Puccinia striiformis f. sp. tritici]
MSHFLNIPTDSLQQLLPGQALSNLAKSGTTTLSSRDCTGGLSNRAKVVHGLLTQVSLWVAITSSAVILSVMLFNLYLEYQSCLLLLTHNLKRATLNDTIASLLDPSSPRRGWLDNRLEDGTLKPRAYKILPPAVINPNNWTCPSRAPPGPLRAYVLHHTSRRPLLVTVFGGQLWSAWFDIRNRTDIHQDADIVRMKTNFRRLIRIIHHHHLDMKRTIIARFSQGLGRLWVGSAREENLRAESHGVANWGFGGSTHAFPG